MKAPADSTRGRAASSILPKITGYRMIESATIQNFKCFERVDLSGFSRMNLVVGDNAAGKTAFLEALFLAGSASPEVVMRLRAWRGIEMAIGVQVQPREVYDAIFGSLLFNGKKNRVGEISIVGSQEDARAVRFYYDSEQPILIQNSGVGVPSQSSSYKPMSFEYLTGAGDLIAKATPTVQPQGIIVPPTNIIRNNDPTWLSARFPFNQAENAAWYSDMSKRGDERKFISALRAQFPEIISLNVELEAGVPAIFAKRKNNQWKIPIAMISDGLTKIVTAFLHVAHSSGTATFLDELENGIHFSRHEKLWPQLLSFAQSYSTQIFASTHSWEFILAALPAIKKHPEEFSIIRVKENKKTGNRLVTVISGKEAIPLIEAGIELRVCPETS